jgi:signal transduction histidine kinase
VVDQTGRCLAVECVARDVTVQVEAALERDELDVVLALTSEVAAGANMAANLEEALGDAVEAICRHRRWAVGRGWVVDESHEWPERPTLTRMSDQRFAAFCDATATQPQVSGEGLVGRVIRESRPITDIDLAASPNGLREHAVAAGLSLGHAYPVVSEGVVVGVLEFFSEDATSAFDGRFSAAMDDIGQHLGHVFERDRGESLLRERDSERSAFLDRAAHELRGPAASIALLAGGLARSAHELSTDDLASSLERLGLQAERVQNLTTRLLELSQLEAGRLDINPTAVALRGVIDAAVRTSLGDGRVEISVPEELTIVADPVLLDEVFVNLLNNAAKYGGPNIRVEAAPSDRGVRVCVSDDGPGVPVEIVPHLFSPLAQRLAGPESAGLGLAIVARLTHLLGGEASYEAIEPNGSRFVIELAAAPGI